MIVQTTGHTEKISEQKREPTNSTRIWRRDRNRAQVKLVEVECSKPFATEKQTTPLILQKPILLSREAISSNKLPCLHGSNGAKEKPTAFNLSAGQSGLCSIQLSDL